MVGYVTCDTTTQEDVMELSKKLQQYGQFGEGDLPAIKEVLSLTADVTDALILYADENEGNLDMLTSDKVYDLRDKMNALVDGKVRVGAIDDLWASIDRAHSRLDEGEIGGATAKDECDAAINGYLGYHQSDLMHIDGSPPGEAGPDESEETKKWRELIEEGAFVTMTVPVQVALMVADSEAGDAHTNAVCNLEEKLCEDFLEEYGVDEEGAYSINEALSKGGA